MQESFDRHFGGLWVEGEVAELARPLSGHAYFTLKDQGARLRAVMWKGRRAYGGAALAEGAAVLVRGRLAVYAPRGEHQLVVDYLEPRGEGALRAAFERLKEKLAAEGLFDAARKRPLPFWPKRIAVLSSPGGAAISDFIQTALARRPGAAISLYPVPVQGAGAAEEMAAALADLNAWGGFDLIVLTRGGGSLSDLWAFNEEALVRAVAASRLPTLAAVGHSTDESLVELAADQRAITPTAAAETVYRDQAQMLRHLANLADRLADEARRACLDRQKLLTGFRQDLERALRDGLEQRRHALANLTWRLGGFERRLAGLRQTLDYAAGDLERALEGWLADRRRRLAEARRTLTLLSPAERLRLSADRLARLRADLAAAAERLLAEKGRRLAGREEQLRLLSPLNILRRGYALATTEQGELLTSSSQARPGQGLRLRLAEGGLQARVTRTFKDGCYEKDQGTEF